MKKSAMIFSLMLPALISGINQAEAKHRGFLETNTIVSSQAENVDEAKDIIKHKDHHDKKMKHKGHWLEHKKHDIEEDYQEALHKIKKSQLPENLKEMLNTQADENRNLALKQAEARAELMTKHKVAREAYNDEFMKDKSNRKAVKEVIDIL